MNKNTVFFRVDCNERIASGHLMRCVSLAQCARNAGMFVVFLMADANSKYLLDRYSFNLINLNSKWDDLIEEIPYMRQIAIKYPSSVLIVDTYSISSTYTAELKDYFKIVYLGSKQVCLPGLKMLINYSTNINLGFYDYYPQEILCLGPKYTPLRMEFEEYVPSTSDIVRRVLITTGNSDTPGFTYNLLKYISENQINNVDFDIVIGSMYHDVERIINLCEHYSNFHVHMNVVLMTEIYKKCQLAISANGTTVYELCACKIPTISFALVNEQEESGESMARLNILKYCGLYKGGYDSTLKRIVSELQFLLKNKDERDALIERASSIIDTRGCKRTIDKILNL